MTEKDAIAQAGRAFPDYTWRFGFPSDEGWILFDDGRGNLAHVTPGLTELFRTSKMTPDLAPKRRQENSGHQWADETPGYFSSVQPQLCLNEGCYEHWREGDPRPASSCPKAAPKP